MNKKQAAVLILITVPLFAYQVFIMGVVKTLIMDAIVLAFNWAFVRLMYSLEDRGS